jgi:hypothetical protein
MSRRASASAHRAAAVPIRFWAALARAPSAAGAHGLPAGIPASKPGLSRRPFATKEERMKRITMLSVFFAIIVSNSFAEELRKSGDCKIQEAKMFDKDKIVSVTLQNAEIQVQCKIYSGEFMEDYALYAIPWITNLGGKKVNVSYQAAFLDSKGELVACVSQNADIPADARDHQLGSSMVMISRAIIDKITSYKIVIYTSESKEK